MSTHVDPMAADSLPDKLPGLVRGEFEDTCKRRFFFGLSNDPYGGTAGLYDLGPPLCAMKNNLLQYWRQHFILEENMCEIDTTSLTPEEVFIASGHKERFNDVMVRDTVTNEPIRADKYLEEWSEKQIADPKASAEVKEKAKVLLATAGALNEKEIQQAIEENGIKSAKGNPLTAPFPFNLMFQTQIGPEGNRLGFARPELAQSIILNMKRLLDSNNASRLPFAGACIGQAYRNEIAPRANLLRVREFTLAEIEHFYNPADQDHPRFAEVADTEFWAYSQAHQDPATAKAPEKMTFKQAIESGMIKNHTLAYFMARTQQFLTAVGIRYIRFRQHLAKEMAHYAQDCWDAELLTSYGWTECVGLADRSAFDLACHIKATGKELTVREEFDKPRIEKVVKRVVNKGAAGKKFGKDTGALVEALNALSNEEALALGKALADGPQKVTLASGKEVEIDAAIAKFEEKDEKVTGRNFVPYVVEPSFGVGRILYAILEQSYWVRRDENDKSGKNDKRAVFGLPPLIAPQKVAVLPLMMKPELTATVAKLRSQLVAAGISTRTDDSGVAIGKKYARIDELGLPFVVTCDYEDDGAVTLRERDTSGQIRVPLTEVVDVIAALCRPMNTLSWKDVAAKYPAQGGAQ